MSEKLVKLQDAIKDFSLVTIEKYIPYSIKVGIVSNVLQVCVSTDQETGFKRVNPAEKKLMLDISICTNATNIEFSDEIISDYDLLKSSGLLKHIYTELNKAESSEDDVWEITCFVDEKIDEIMRVENGIENTLYRCLDKLISKIPSDKELKSLSKSLVKDLKNLDFSKMPEIMNAIKFNNGLNVDKPKSGVN